MFDYLLCGWHVRSDRALTLLSALDGASGEPDIHVRHGQIGTIDEAALFSSPFMTVYANGHAVVRIGEGLSILVADGKKVMIEAAEEIAQGEVMTFLLGPALGLLCHQRKVLPLHGASVRIGDKAVTIVGQSGAGKSTSATALIGRGHQLLCDDITVVDAAEATVRPSYPAIKLWQDAADVMAIRTVDLDRTRAGVRKFHYPAGRSFAESSTALGAVILLNQKSNIEFPSLTPLTKINALGQLSRQVYRRRLAVLLGAEQAYYQQLGQLVSQVPVMLLDRPMSFDMLDSAIDLIESAVGR